MINSKRIAIIFIVFLPQFMPASSSAYDNHIENDDLERMPELWNPGNMKTSNDLEIMNPEYMYDDYDAESAEFLLQQTQQKMLPPKKPCKTCQNSVTMSTDELTALRIEFVKNQILKKLRLSERPKVSAHDLPRPVTEHLIPMPDVDNKERQLEDYYAKTTKKVIFLQEGRFLNRSLCF